MERMYAGMDKDGEAYELDTENNNNNNKDTYFFYANHETDHHPFDLWASICGRQLTEKRGKKKE